MKRFVFVAPWPVHPGTGVNNVILGLSAAMREHAVLLDTYKRVARLAGVRLVLIGGDGPERTAVTARAAEMGVECHVNMPQAEVWNWMKHAECLVLPSYEEPFGIVLLEAGAGSHAGGCHPSGRRSRVCRGRHPWLTLRSECCIYRGGNRCHAGQRGGGAAPGRCIPASRAGDDVECDMEAVSRCH